MILAGVKFPGLPRVPGLGVCMSVGTTLKHTALRPPEDEDEDEDKEEEVVISALVTASAG